NRTQYFGRRPASRPARRLLLSCAAHLRVVSCPLASEGDSAMTVKAGGSVERRKVARFLLRCPVIFEWTDQGARSHAGAGFTRDISTTGVFVHSSAPPPHGSQLQINVLLPAQQSAEEGLKLSSGAKVVRIEKIREGAGFAAISEFELVGEAAGRA